MAAKPNIRQRLIATIRRAVEWGDRRVPPGLRSLVGILCMIGGVFGLLPIVGFWMFPVGVAFIALDIPPLRRRLLRHGAAEKGGDRPDR